MTDAEYMAYLEKVWAYLARKSQETGVPAVDIITPTDEELSAFVAAKGEAEAGLAAIQDWTAAKIGS